MSHKDNIAAASAPPQADEAIGLSLRFGLGAWIVTTGTHAGEPCVFIDDAPEAGEVGASAPNVPAGTTPRVRLLFPSAEQAKRVSDALVTPTAPPQAVQGEAAAWADMRAAGDNIGLSWERGVFHTTPLYLHPAMPIAASGDVVELAMAVERALGWRDGKRDDELDSLLATAMGFLDNPQPAQVCDQLLPGYPCPAPQSCRENGCNAVERRDYVQAASGDIEQRARELLAVDTKRPTYTVGMLESAKRLLAAFTPEHRDAIAAALAQQVNKDAP